MKSYLAPVNKKFIWITWEKHRRTRTLAEKLSAELHEITYAKPAFFRYLYSITHTLYLLIKTRPDFLLVQSPSYVLSFMTAILKPIFRYKLIIDAHNGVTYRIENNFGFTTRIIKHAVKCSDLVIVTSTSVVPTLIPYQTNITILPDCLPSINCNEMPPQFKKFPRPHLTLIASFQHDEPIATILNSCLKSFDNTPGHIFVTGRAPDIPELSKFKAQSNITFTNFLSFEDFDGLIANSDLLIDISTNPTILVCGGYEAVAVGVPCIVADSEVSRGVFRKGFLYAKNNEDSYQSQIMSFMDAPDKYKEDIKQFKNDFSLEWDDLFLKTLKSIEDIGLKLG